VCSRRPSPAAAFGWSRLPERSFGVSLDPRHRRWPGGALTSQRAPPPDLGMTQAVSPAVMSPSNAVLRHPTIFGLWSTLAGSALTAIEEPFICLSRPRYRATITWTERP
jgi:hypothetical protein